MRGLRRGVHLDGGRTAVLRRQELQERTEAVQGLQGQAGQPPGGRGRSRASGWKRSPPARLAARRRRCRSGRRRAVRSSARNASSPGSSPGLAASSSTGLAPSRRSTSCTRRDVSPGAVGERGVLSCDRSSRARIHLERFHADRRTGGRRRDDPRPEGQDHLGEGDELLKDKVNSLVNQGHKKIVLNLADVPYIDSAGLGEIVRTYTTVSRRAAASSCST